MKVVVPLSIATLLLISMDVAAQNIDLLRQGVVKVVASGSGQSQTAAGFIVRAEERAVFIATASHVVEGADQIGIEFFDERRLYPARVLGMEGGDKERGLAALIVENDVPANVVALTINRDLDVRAGEPVTMIGFPRSVAVPWAVTKGGIVGRRGRSIIFDGAVEEGNSGGPLVKDGEVVGLITQAQGQFAYAAPSLILQYALESWGVRFGTRLRSTPALLAPLELPAMFKKRGFNHPESYSPGTVPLVDSTFGSFTHEYVSEITGTGRVVLDFATGLMWLPTGSDEWTESGRQVYIDQLRTSKYGGFADWRIPTIEELASLIESRAITTAERWQFLDPLFRYQHCASADAMVSGSTIRQVLGIHFPRGTILTGYQDLDLSVCAVRSMKPDELGRRRVPSNVSSNGPSK
jgi:hypothetical protein